MNAIAPTFFTHWIKRPRKRLYLAQACHLTWENNVFTLSFMDDNYNLSIIYWKFPSITRTRPLYLRPPPPPDSSIIIRRRRMITGDRVYRRIAGEPTGEEPFNHRIPNDQPASWSIQPEIEFDSEIQEPEIILKLLIIIVDRWLHVDFQIKWADDPPRRRQLQISIEWEFD